jgi:acetylornithine deacetylase
MLTFPDPRIVPRTTPEKAMAGIEATVRAAAHASVHGGSLPERRTTAVNDTRYYGLYFDIPGLCYGSKGEGAHAFDERTSIEDLRKCTRTMATFIANWCGLRAVSVHVRSPESL